MPLFFLCVTLFLFARPPLSTQFSLSHLPHHPSPPGPSNLVKLYTRCLFLKSVLKFKMIDYHVRALAYAQASTCQTLSESQSTPDVRVYQDPS